MYGRTVSENAVRRTLVEYCQTLDDGRFDEWIDLFTTDIVFTVMGQRLEGRGPLREFIEPTQQADARGRHMLSEPLIDIDGDEARVTTDYAFISRDDRVTSSGRYHDVLRKEPDRWRIARREIVFTGDQPTSTEEHR
jgi:3-phenylpropionate/cinnamic acid dioxygenase small subunit